MADSRPTSAAQRRAARVLIVDDSASVRTTLSAILSSDPQLEVMGTAADCYAAAERIRQELPDVIFLDIEMPRMDGITFLKKIMSQKPIPVVICSSYTEDGSDALMNALAAGAVDVVTKPRVGTTQFLQDSRIQICDIAKAAAHARIGKARRELPPVAIEAKLSADAMIPPLTPGRLTALKKSLPVTEPIICLGASTGGTEALAELLAALPANAPGVVVVQHMPEKFTAAFARRLNGLCRISVKEAEDGDAVLPGRALIAPGNKHMMLARKGGRYAVSVTDGPFVCRHRPSVDVLFRSASQAAGRNAVAALLTGMGDDGAAGLLEMRQMGAFTVAQDEATSVVFGMPREAIERGAAAKVLPLGKVAGELVRAATDAAGAPAR